MVPTAPERLSTTIGWFRAVAIPADTIRVTASMPPPAGTGTTHLIGLSGYVAVCAHVSAATIASMAEQIVVNTVFVTARRPGWIFEWVKVVSWSILWIERHSRLILISPAAATVVIHQPAIRERRSAHDTNDAR